MYSVCPTPIQPQAIPVTSFMGSIQHTSHPSIPDVPARFFGDVNLLNEIPSCADDNVLDLDCSNPSISVYASLLWYVMKLQQDGLYNEADTFYYNGPQLHAKDYLPKFTSSLPADHYINLLGPSDNRGVKSSLIAYSNTKEGAFVFTECFFLKLPFIGQHTLLTYAYIKSKLEVTYSGTLLRRNARWHARVGAQHVMYKDQYGGTSPLFGCYRSDYSTMFLKMVLDFHSKDTEADFLLHHPAGPGLLVE